MLAPPLGIGHLTHAFWAEVRQRVNKAQRNFRQEFKRIGIKGTHGLCQYELLLWCGIRHREILSQQHYIMIHDTSATC